MPTTKPSFLNLRVYQLSEALSDEIWKIVTQWNHFAKFTIGKQLVTAADGIGSNIAEGVGRISFQDNRRFIRIARGSFNETRHWLRRANNRRLLTPEQIDCLKKIMDQLGPRLNAYLNSIGPIKEKTELNRKRTTDD